MTPTTLTGTDRQAGVPAASEAVRYGWRRALLLSPELADFDRRGFRAGAAGSRRVLETAAGTFLAGFNAELAVTSRRAPLFPELPHQLRGFGVEGAAMAATLLDLIHPGHPRRLPALLDAYGPRHIHLIHVGVGWAMAKLRWRGWQRLSHLDPLLRWLAYDGWGFARGFFATGSRLDRLRRHRWRCTPGCAIRYQGLGRSLWFRECADPDGLAHRVAALPRWHRGDAWSGVALAATYAGGAAAGALARVPELAAGHQPELAQGAAFAAEAWRRSGQLPAHAAPAVAALAGTTVEQAAGWTREAAEGLRSLIVDASTYQLWRRRIQLLASR